MITYMLDDKVNTEKPTSVNAKSLKEVTETIDKLINDIESGKTIRPGILTKKGSSDKDWIKQDLIFIDVDDETIEHSIEVCNKFDIKPIFMYKSFNYEKNNKRHRLVFKLEETEYNKDTIIDLVYFLIKAFNADTRCTNLSRLYYGTKYKVFNINKSACINKDLLDKLLKDESIAQTPHGFFKLPTPSNETNNRVSNVNKVALKDPQLKDFLLLIPKGISCGSFSQLNDLKGSVFNSYSDIAKHFMKLDLALFLGGKNIKCILPEHGEDKHPSASVYQSDNGYYYYKCHACDNKPMDIYALIALAYGITGPNNYVFYKCTNILIDTFELKLSNDNWKKEQDRIIKANKMVLKAANTNNFIYLKKYPKTAKEFIKRTSLLRVLTDEALIALEVCPTKGKKNKLLFNTSLRYIAKDINKDFSNVGRWIKFLCYLGFIEKIDHRQIKNTKMGKMLAKYSEDKVYSKVPQLYSIPEWTEEVFKLAEERYIDFKKNGGTIKGATKRQFDALKSKGVVIQANKETERIRAIREEIKLYLKSKKGYCLLKDLRAYGKTRGYSSRLVSSFISEISKDKDFEFYRYTNKKVKQKYNIPNEIHHSNPIFIIKDYYNSLKSK